MWAKNSRKQNCGQEFVHSCDKPTASLAGLHLPCLVLLWKFCFGNKGTRTVWEGGGCEGDGGWVGLILICRLGCTACPKAILRQHIVHACGRPCTTCSCDLFIEKYLLKIKIISLGCFEWEKDVSWTRRCVEFGLGMRFLICHCFGSAYMKKKKKLIYKPTEDPQIGRYPKESILSPDQLFPCIASLFWDMIPVVMLAVITLSAWSEPKKVAENTFVV